MTHVTVKLKVSELELLIGLASDQLFRREFIDPRLPGHQPNAAELNVGKQLVGRLRLLVGAGLQKTVTVRRPASPQRKT